MYYASHVGNKPDKETVRNDAAGLFGCADLSVNKVNAMVFKENGDGVCISNGDGCGDCFGKVYTPDISCRVTDREYKTTVTSAGDAASVRHSLWSREAAKPSCHVHIKRIVQIL